MVHVELTRNLLYIDKLTLRSVLLVAVRNLSNQYVSCAYYLKTYREENPRLSEIVSSVFGSRAGLLSTMTCTASREPLSPPL